MTSIDTKTIDSFVTRFEQLPVDDQIAALGYLYQEIGESLPSIAVSDKVEDLLDTIGDMREGSQIEFMQDVFNDRANSQDEVALDPHPSKALLELIPGDNVEPPLSEYHKLSLSERLSLWHQLASKMGDEIIAIPSDYALSSEATKLLDSLKSLGTEEKVNFLSQII